MNDEIKLVPIANRVYAHQLAKLAQRLGWPWMLRFPFVIVSRKRLKGWTWDCVDNAVYRTAKVFRGEELP